MKITKSQLEQIIKEEMQSSKQRERWDPAHVIKVPLPDGVRKRYTPEYQEKLMGAYRLKLKSDPKGRYLAPSQEELDAAEAVGIAPKSGLGKLLRNHSHGFIRTASVAEEIEGAAAAAVAKVAADDEDLRRHRASVRAARRRKVPVDFGGMTRQQQIDAGSWASLHEGLRERNKMTMARLEEIVKEELEVIVKK
mgnify:CR=1 FL=1|tara:strand:+ start:50 stop:631 length:582 start_codon:yes stop_codon:yes gene_type:complete